MKSCCQKAMHDIIAEAKMSKTDKSVGRYDHQDIKMQLSIHHIHREMRESEITIVLRGGWPF